MKAYENVICIIPARAGSQGIIDKNIQLIHGIPLVAHSILHALDAGLDPKNIYVSSDSNEILDIARREGVVAQKRPASISGPESSTEEALLWTYRCHCSLLPEQACNHVLLLQPTSPIRFKNTVKQFLDFYLEHDYDSALTTTKFYNFFWKKGSPATSSYDPVNRPMRQNMNNDDDVTYFDNGNMYLTRVDVLQNKKCRLGDNVGIFPISELEGMQIDTPEDLQIFRAIFSGKIPEKIGL